MLDVAPAILRGHLFLLASNVCPQRFISVRWLKRADRRGRLLGTVESLSVLAGTEFERKEYCGRSTQEVWRREYQHCMEISLCRFLGAYDSVYCFDLPVWYCLSSFPHLLLVTDRRHARWKRKRHRCTNHPNIFCKKLRVTNILLRFLEKLNFTPRLPKSLCRTY